MAVWDEYVYNVGSTSILLYSQDNDNPIKNAVLASVINGTDLNAEIESYLLNNIYFHIKRAINYAESIDYVGTAEGYKEYRRPNREFVRGVIQSQVESSRISITHYFIDYPNSEFFIWGNTTPVDTPIFSTSLNAQQTLTKPYGIGNISMDSNTDTITVTFTMEYDDYTFAGEGGDPQHVVRSGTESFIVPNLDTSHLYLHAAYIPTDINGDPLVIGEDGEGNPIYDTEPRYWYTDAETSPYPELRLDRDEIDLESPFLPIAFLREGNTDLTAAEFQGTQEYIQRNTFFKKLGLNMEDIAASINENPDIDDIDHAYFNFGLDINTQSTVGKKYLFDFFDWLSSYQQNDKSVYTAWSLSPKTITVNHSPLQFQLDQLEGRPTNYLNITYPNQNKIKISYAYIDKQTITGSIGDVDTITSSITTLPNSNVYVNFTGDEGSDIAYTLKYEESYITIRKQVTVNSYIELEVKGLLHSNLFFERGIAFDYPVLTNLATALEENNDNFWIPLHKDIVFAYPLNTQNLLYRETMRLTFNSVDVQKLGFFESSLFAGLVEFAGILMLVTSFGTNSWGTQLAARIGVANATAQIVVGAILQSAIGVAIVKGAAALVRELGLENSILGDIIKIAVAAYFANKTATIDATFADKILAAVSVVQDIDTVILQEEIEDLQRTAKEFWEKAEEQEDILAEAQKLLDTGNSIDPNIFSVSLPYFDPNETVTGFYERTIHLGNAGTIGFDMIHNYVDTALQLPSTRTAITGLS